MADPLLHVGATGNCPHSGTITIKASSRVKLSNQMAATASDTFMIAGCTFTVSQKPQPCVKVKWLSYSKKIKIEGRPAVLVTSQGVCESADMISQGVPNITNKQVKVKGI